MSEVLTLTRLLQGRRPNMIEKQKVEVLYMVYMKLGTVD